MSLREVKRFSQSPWLGARARSFTDFLPAGLGSGNTLTRTPVARIHLAIKVVINRSILKSFREADYKLDGRRTQGKLPKLRHQLKVD